MAHWAEELPGSIFEAVQDEIISILAVSRRYGATLRVLSVASISLFRYTERRGQGRKAGRKAGGGKGVYHVRSVFVFFKIL